MSDIPIGATVRIKPSAIFIGGCGIKVGDVGTVISYADFTAERAYVVRVIYRPHDSRTDRFWAGELEIIKP